MSVTSATVQTLSANGVPDSHQVSGLLFVPTLAEDDPCSEIASIYVPKNVTRYEDVLAFGYPAIGIAPWISVECTNSYLVASREAKAEAMIFYQPSTNETGIPPPASDICWNLNDNDRWKQDNPYPVYAIPGPAATTLMRELAWFSDGKTNRSHDDSYPSFQKRDSNVRLFTVIANGEPPQYPIFILTQYLTLRTKERQTDSTPSLWSIVLITLGSIFGLSLIVYIVWLTLQRRGLLQPARLGAHPQENVEAIPMTRATTVHVPREILEQLPLYTYAGPRSPSVASLVKEEVEADVAEIDPSGQSPEPPTEEIHQELPRDAERVVGIRRPAPAVISGGVVASRNPYRLSHTQNMCAICLDAFVIGSTRVRELPCGHVFDPECVDPWLLTNGECPLCKMSILASGSINTPAA
ncbi:uncharacterized protein N7496_009632 [Penicillium cataractarum]|uniref:RING-type domain-containing protein n=1 Tax=Penicillium cataractarum TaxID=2100454 RepID=A0A9W9RRX3_9EURO|nr:uncharacterized protein N7496_009632 [Penicillium cataractarum]KAJ5363919.1 hypothetical protein N7496_009632 [Penicillium cataractarum]